ncbi:MAG: AmmeMemoRadiSam system radical SAM enzyme, partial [Candidatus Woesearchaeota archaeon]
CRLCPHNCMIAEGSRGICGVRENQKGTLYALTYGKPVATAVDPIEKKPLYHFLPGTQSYSIACVGCNMKCSFCQNSDISQMPKEGRIIGTNLAPEEVVTEAIQNSCQSISYTYTEPTVFFEYCYDIARIARQKRLKNVFVTNGFITTEAIGAIAPYLDAANIDLKSFTESYYKKLCGARLKPVLEAIREYHQKGVHIEITTLVVPGHNDKESELKKMAKFIASIDKKIPWHISRFYPRHKMQGTTPTPEAILHKARQIGKEEGLCYVYLGNTEEDENTYCHNCEKLLIRRKGYHVIENNLDDNKCKYCNTPL